MLNKGSLDPGRRSWSEQLVGTRGPDKFESRHWADLGQSYGSG